MGRGSQMRVLAKSCIFIRGVMTLCRHKKYPGKRICPGYLTTIVYCAAGAGGAETGGAAG